MSGEAESGKPVIWLWLELCLIRLNIPHSSAYCVTLVRPTPSNSQVPCYHRYMFQSTRSQIPWSEVKLAGLSKRRLCYCPFETKILRSFGGVPPWACNYSTIARAPVIQQPLLPWPISLMRVPFHLRMGSALVKLMLFQDRYYLQDIRMTIPVVVVHTLPPRRLVGSISSLTIES